MFIKGPGYSGHPPAGANSWLAALNPMDEPAQQIQSVVHWWIVFAVVILLFLASDVGHFYILRYVQRRLRHIWTYINLNQHL